MPKSGARPNSASSSFPCKRLPRCSEASSWPDSLRCLMRESCTCPIRNSRYLSTLLAGSHSSTPSALVLYAKCPFGGPQQVLSYLANYTHRVALSNRRIVAVDARHQSVTFTYRDYRHGSQRKELTLSALEFIRRFSLTILPPGLVRIRHYGILGNNRRKRHIQRHLYEQIIRQFPPPLLVANRTMPSLTPLTSVPAAFREAPPAFRIVDLERQTWVGVLIASNTKRDCIHFS